MSCLQVFLQNAPHTQAGAWGEQLQCSCWHDNVWLVQLLSKRGLGIAQRPTSSSTAISSLLYPIVLSALLHSSLSSVRDTNEVLAGPVAAAAAPLLVATAAAPALLLMLLLLSCAECMLLMVPLGVGELPARVGGGAAAAALWPVVQKGTRAGPRWAQIGVRVIEGRFGPIKLRIVCGVAFRGAFWEMDAPFFAAVQATSAPLKTQTEREMGMIRKRSNCTCTERTGPLGFNLAFFAL